MSTTTLTAASATAFAITFMAKYTKTIVGCYTYRNFKPRPVSEDPKYTSRDVSVVIPTVYEEPEKLKECVDAILKSGPRKIFVVCGNDDVLECKKLLRENDCSQITVLGVPKMNKRVQILKALEHVVTDIVVLADDDVFWPDSDYVRLLLGIFEDDGVGAGGTRQRVRREENPGIWNFLGIGYLERRTWNNATTNAIDGSISTLSGRTAAYRAEILQTEEFRHYFLNDSWRGEPLNSDDDKCLTRYVYSRGWKIAIQFDPRAVLETTVESGQKYLKQCLRWGRAHWRGNFTVMENEKYWCSRKMLWGTYVIYFGSLLTPAIFWEGLMWYFLNGAVGGTIWAPVAYALFAIFIFISKIVKYVPHFERYPDDMAFVPIAIAFSYFHGFLNLYCLATMKTTHWGSKDVNDTTPAVSAASQGMSMVVAVQHEVKFATSGHENRYSVDGRDHFRATVPGSSVMAKKEVQEYFVELARKFELPSIDDEEEKNGLKGALHPALTEEMCDALSQQLCANEEDALAWKDEAEQVWVEGERMMDGAEGLGKNPVVGVQVVSIHKSIESIESVESDTIDEKTNSDNSAEDTTILDTTTDDTTTDDTTLDALTKEKCTGGCPYKGQIYDSLPMLMRN